MTANDARRPVFALALALALWFLGAAGGFAQDAFVGLWEPGIDGQFYWVGTNWNDLLTKNLEMSRKGFQLVDLDVYEQGGEHRFATVWRSASPGASFDRFSWDEFTRENDRRTSHGQRLIRYRQYKEGSDTRHVGVWTPGTDAFYLWVGAGWPDFNAKWEELSRGGLRLVDLETWMEGSERKWAGVWREGSDAHFLFVNKDWGEFQAKNDELSRQGFHLTVLRTYKDGSTQRYAGVWRGGAVSQRLVKSEDFEKLGGRIDQLAGSGLLLSRLATLPARADCSNQVVDTGSYDYGIPGSPLHCEGPPAGCGSASSGARYHWPVTNAGTSGDHRLLLSALEPMDSVFTLPFYDRQVRVVGGWLYDTGSWHHAIDYHRPDAASFPARAAAAGRVIFVGWHVQAGNTVVVSHDINGTDTYRTIYMHLRNGPHNDCDMSWNQSVGDIGDQTRRYNYKARLNSTGCSENLGRHPVPLFWGTDSQKLASDLFGKTLQAGDLIGWAGETGPGGAGLGSGPSSPVAFPNTHLHVFFARRATDSLSPTVDASGNPIVHNWYFFDPYGVYSQPRFYGSTVTSPPPSDCARYPIAWKDGQPQYQSTATDGSDSSAGQLCGGCTANVPGTRGTCAQGLVCHAGRCEEPCPPNKMIDERCKCVDRPPVITGGNGNRCDSCSSSVPGTRGTCGEGLVCHNGRCEDRCQPWQKADDSCRCVSR